MDASTQTTVRCTLCGLRFAIGDAVSACGGCPLKGRCGLVRCPNCGFELPAPARAGRRQKGEKWPLC